MPARASTPPPTTMSENQNTLLPHPTRDYPSDDELISDPIQPALDTVFSGFDGNYQELQYLQASSPQVRDSHPDNHSRDDLRRDEALDLRSLDYIASYDSHLMCPICHVPFVDPVVLDCDHTFCSSCYAEYKEGGNHNERSQCPSCRTYVISSPKKASRLISNMCDDIKVSCPNEDCLTVLPRAYIERHALRDCAEQTLKCPDPACTGKTKRKNFVPGQCIHSSHIECDCGAVIQLGRGEWLKHKDEDCPNAGVKCEHCSERISVRDYLDINKQHQCRSEDLRPRCPGEDFGCEDEVTDGNLKAHISSCVFARLAPHLSRQSRMVSSLADQLAQFKLRNEALSSGLEDINHLLTYTIQPKLDQWQQEQEVEEIHRDEIPAGTNHRDLLLPAHLRDLTPSPTLSAAQFSHYHPTLHPSLHSQQYANLNSSPSLSTANVATSAHLLSLHESLRATVHSLETDVHQLQGNLTELDARTSMALMNETLRLKEELAHANAALFSTRAQVQWLLNRERISMRARPPSFNTTGGPSLPNPSPGVGQAQQSPSLDGTITMPGSDTGEAGMQSSSSASPVFDTSRLVRRTSGASQDRVKL